MYLFFYSYSTYAYIKKQMCQIMILRKYIWRQNLHMYRSDIKLTKLCEYSEIMINQMTNITYYNLVMDW